MYLKCRAALICKPFKTLVGERGFEPPTPCAQGGFKGSREVACFQPITFLADTGSPLKSVEPG